MPGTHWAESALSASQGGTDEDEDEDFSDVEDERQRRTAPNHATRRAPLVCAYAGCACDLAWPDMLAPYSAEPSGRKKSTKRKSKATWAREAGGKWERKGDPLFRRETEGRGGVSFHLGK